MTIISAINIPSCVIFLSLPQNMRPFYEKCLKNITEWKTRFLWALTGMFSYFLTCWKSRSSRCNRDSPYYLKNSTDVVFSRTNTIDLKPEKTPKKLFLYFFKLPIDKTNILLYNSQAMLKRLVGQAVKTSASHAENMGSIPVRVTINNLNRIIRFRLFFFIYPYSKWVRSFLFSPSV